MIVDKTLEVEDGEPVRVVSFGKLTVMQLQRLAWICAVEFTIERDKAEHVVKMLRRGRKGFSVEAGGESIDSAVELALGELTVAMRDSGTGAAA